MFYKKLKRLALLLSLRFLNGYARARVLKSLNYFRRIGDGCYLGTVNFGTEPYLISFGNNVGLGTGVLFINHDMSADMVSILKFGRSDRLSMYGEIDIGDNVFIGANSIVLPGVKIGSNVVIGAGSIIAKDIPSGGVYVGAGRFVKSFDQYVCELVEGSGRQRSQIDVAELVDNGHCLRKRNDVYFER